MTEVEDLRAQLKAALKSRAMVYSAVHDEIAQEYGEAKAEEILKRAIYKRGAAICGKFHACPLKEAWEDAQFSPKRIETLCRIAGFVDNGTFEQAGFELQSDTWKPGEEGCCFLHIRRKA